MVDDRARRVHAIFVEALEQPEERCAAFVAEACAGDDELRRDVERLLSAVDRTTDFLEMPVLGPTARGARRPAEPVPLDIPGYRIIRTLGAGGMATVYEAEQANPRRRVALKVMRQSLSETSALRRFHLEAEILARLKHPGIAQIHEVGTLDDQAGHAVPFFTMELVDEARPLTEYTVAELDLRERLGMFADVCDAVRCGHQAGIIHRDLKPSNVLVDGTGQVKVIDFGIARPLTQLDGRITLDEGRGLIGTLNYMSPEQCTGGDGIDTRTDVYALGVIVYELVTGRLPLDLSTTSIPEAARIIETVKPARPSSVVREASGDLELIILTAIDKDPRRRYRSAAELGDDIRRYLSNQPIQARPATALYHARKFAQRHLTLVAGGAVLLAVLVGAVLVTSRMAYVADQARAAAERREYELEQVADFQRLQLSNVDVVAIGAQLRDQFVARLGAPDDAEALVADLNFTTLAMNLLNDHVLEPSRGVIDERFADNPLLRARLLHTVAGTMITLGLSERAEPILADALAIRRELAGPDHVDTLESARSLGTLLGTMGRYEQAEAMLRDTLTRADRVLGPEDRLTLKIANNLGGVLRYMGRVEEAQRIWETTLDRRRRVLGGDHDDTLVSLNNVGVICAVRGDLDGAEAAWRELLERRRRLFGASHPEYLKSLTNLGLLFLEHGELAAARDLLERSLASLLIEQGEDHPGTLSTMVSLGETLAELEDPAAEGVLRRCYDTRTRVLGARHPRTLRSRAQLAAFVACHGRADEAAAATQDLRWVLSWQRDNLGAEHAHTLESMHLLGQALLAQGHAEEAYVVAAECVERVRARNPTARVANARFVIGMADALVALGRFGEAEAVYLQVHDDLARDLGSDRPHTLAVRQALADLHDAWHLEEPLGGHDVSASEWRNR